MRTYALSPESREPLYRQLFLAMEGEIRQGVMAEGEKLPSKRALAEHLNVSPITVENAYQLLLSAGLVASRPRSGYYVAAGGRERPAPPKEPEPQAPTASAAQFPYSVWARLMRGVLLDHHDALLRPSPGQGLLALRQAIAGMLQRTRGMQVNPEQILVGAGAEYFYNILLQLLGRDRCYGLEDPGHRKIRQVYGANGVSMAPLPLDHSGVLPEAVEAEGVQILHISPSHQFPTGTVMPLGRRRQLLDWLAQKEERYLIEDDYDCEFRFSGRPLPTMSTLDPTGRALYLNTFSRTITPALRISYLILPPQLLARYWEQLGFYSCTVPSLEQLTLAEFLNQGGFERHVARMRRHYRVLRDTFLALLAASPLAGRWQVWGQEAGLHVLLRLETARTDLEAERLLLDQGVRAAGLSRYCQTHCPEGCWVVMSYSELSEQELPRVVEALEQLVQGA